MQQKQFGPELFLFDPELFLSQAEMFSQHAEMFLLQAEQPLFDPDLFLFDPELFPPQAERSLFDAERPLFDTELSAKPEEEIADGLQPEEGKAKGKQWGSLTVASSSGRRPSPKLESRVLPHHLASGTRLSVIFNPCSRSDGAPRIE